MDNSPRLTTSFKERSTAARISGVIDEVIFYGLIAVLILTALPYGAVEPRWVAVFQCVVFALGFLWCIHALLVRPSQAGDLRLFFPLIALVAFAILQSLSLSQTSVAGLNVAKAISADPFESWIFALRLSAITLAGVLAVRFTCHALRLNVLVNTIILVALLSAIFGIVRLTLQHSDGFVLQYLRIGGGFAQFINKNHFAFVVEPAMGLLVAMMLFRSDAGYRRLVYVAAIILLWAALVMSRSRGGVLAVAVQMVMAALVLIYSQSRLLQSKNALTRRVRLFATTTLTVFAIAIIVTTTIVWLGGDQLETGIQTATTEISSPTNDNHEGARRRDIWRATLRMARAHPLAGAGFGGYWAEISAYHDASGVLSPQQAHNDYLELLASGGVVGVVIFLWFVIALVRQIRKALQTVEGFQRVIVMGAAIGIAGVAVHSLIDFGLHITSNAVIFVMLLSILNFKKIDQRPNLLSR